ncbi:hypothetical protein AB0C93_16710 [Streptomyces sp. NPDC048518]|uniref:hypothetical protein n=1 Tax=Streptomyces sp. NPDC048518 TaxID=3155029 RepID=UPI0033EFDB52
MNATLIPLRRKPIPRRQTLIPLRETAPLPRYATRVLGAALAAAAYLTCLPWDLRNRAETAGSIDETSPVTATGATALVLALLSLSAYFGLRDRLPWTLVLVAAPPSALMFVSFDSHPTQDANVWPLTWAFVTLVMGVGVLVTAGVARRFRTVED